MNKWPLLAHPSLVRSPHGPCELAFYLKKMKALRPGFFYPQK